MLRIHLFVVYHAFFFFFFFLLGLYPRHMEVPRRGVQPELQLLATATAPRAASATYTTGQRQSWIPHTLSESRNRTSILMDTSQIHFHCAMMGTSLSCLFFNKF